MKQRAIGQASRSKHLRIAHLSLVIVGVFLCTSAWSQVPAAPARADAELIRQQERERALREQSETRPDVHLRTPEGAVAERLPADERPCFRIDRIELRDDPERRFAWSLAAASPSDDPALGRCLGAQGINLVMRRIQNAIVAHGYVTTRVLAQPQDLTGGTLALTIIPGRIRAVRLAADSDPRSALWNAMPARPGDLLNLRDIEQGLEDLRRLPTVETDIRIVPAEGPGAAPGESDLVVRWRQVSRWRANLGVDDSGTRATGKDQGSATLSLDHPLGLNDLFYLTWNQNLVGDAAAPHGTHGHVVHYSLPFGYWQLALTGSRNSYYQSVAGINQTYRYAGRSSNAEIKLSRVVFRDDVRRLTASLKAWQRTSNNYIDDTEVQVQRRRMGGWEAGLEDHETLGGIGFDAALAYRQGTGAFNSLPAPEENFGEGTARPRFFTASAQLAVPFSIAAQAMRYSAAWRGQWNRTPLVPQDRFILGGRFSIRGYDGENILSAERGWLIRNDLGLVFPEARQELYVGLDHGEVGGPSAAALVANRLTGIVAGWRGAFKDVSFDVFVGQPVGKPPRFDTPARTTGFSVSWSI